MAAYLIRAKTKEVFGYNTKTARRSDLSVFRGTLEEAKAEADRRYKMMHSIKDEEMPSIGASEAKMDSGVTQDMVMNAIAQLSVDDPADYTSTGIPRVEAIESVLGTSINAAMRDDAWAAMRSA